MTKEQQKGKDLQISLREKVHQIQSSPFSGQKEVCLKPKVQNIPIVRKKVLDKIDCSLKVKDCETRVSGLWGFSQMTSHGSGGLGLCDKRALRLTDIRNEC